MLYSQKASLAFIIFFVIFSYSNGTAQSGWFWQNPLPESNLYFQVHFKNANTGIAVGGSNSIIRTTNGGNNWLRVTSLESNILLCCNYAGNNIYYAAGPPNILIKSTNSGMNWFNLNSPDSIINSISFINPNTGFAASLKGALYYTTNGGMNWSNIISPQTMYSSFNTRVQFINNSTVYFLTERYLFKSTNYGSSWDTVLTYNNYVFNYVDFINSNTGIVTCKGDSALKTTNGGTSWIKTNIETGIHNTGLCFVDENNVYVSCNVNSLFSSDYRLYKSTNGGTNWSSLDIFNSKPVMGSRNGNVLSFGGYSTVLLSTNNGNNWNNKISGSVYTNYELTFVDALTGFATGDYGTILKTTNGGTNWNRLTTNTKITFRCVEFINANTGFAAGDSSVIAKTTDSGLNWTLQKATNEVYTIISGISFADNNTGIACAGLQYIFKTTNCGQNWFRIQGANISLRKIQMMSQQTIYSAFFNYFFKSTNGGSDWIGYPIDLTTFESWDLDFKDLNYGFIACDSGIYKTTNSGINWTKTNTLQNNYFSSVSFLNNDLGIAVGKNGKILKTTNSGLNWEEQNASTYTSLLDCKVINDSVYYVCGYNGTIMKTIDGGTSSITQIGTTIPDNYTLYQNYPNPFNSQTTIEFDIVDNNIYVLEVYDCLGRKVDVVFNKYLNAGNYKINYNANKLSSGVYFYRMRSDKVSNTRRFIIIK